MSKSTQSIFALFIAVTIALGLGGCLEGTNKSSRAPQMTKIVFKQPAPLSRDGDSTAGIPLPIPVGDSAYCSPTDLNYTPNDTTLRAGARIYYPITSQPPSQVVETTQPVTVGIIAQ